MNMTSPPSYDHDVIVVTRLFGIDIESFIMFHRGVR